MRIQNDLDGNSQKEALRGGPAQAGPDYQSPGADGPAARHSLPAACHESRRRGEAGGPGVPGTSPTLAPAGEVTWRDRWPDLAASISDLPSEGPAVYFLIRDDQIVYVGSS